LIGSRCILTLVLLAFALIAPVQLAAQKDGFAAWLQALRQDALKKGISTQTLDVALADAAPIERVLQLQERQPESRLSWAEYGKRVVSQDRILRGRRQMEQQRELLHAIAEKYGVQPRFLVALWGVESDFGHHTGDTPAVSALATLGWAGRRGTYFRSELLELLTAVESGYAQPVGLYSSWAGALGQCQFMPSNFKRFAVDYDGDGVRDIWTSTGDVLASMARFLSHLGWNPDQTWGRAVLLPTGFDTRLAGRDTKMRLAKWDELGIRRLNGGKLPRRDDLWATLVLPDGPRGDAFLVYDDFFTLMRWNRSYHFALSVGTLSDHFR
jgi:membrane-bound lytic murein transglycosylase B